MCDEKKSFFGEMLSQTPVTWKIKFRLFLEGQIGRLDCNIYDQLAFIGKPAHEFGGRSECRWF